MLKEIYSSKIDQYQLELTGLKKKDFQYSIGRFAAIILSGLNFYYFLEHSSEGFIAGTLIFLALFIFMLLEHLKLRKRIGRTRNFIKTNQEELEYLNGKVYPDNEGREFIDSEHLFANDLDLFGSNSLFQNLNRTTTKKGRLGLVASLKRNEVSEDFGPRQQAVKELATKLEWRQSFRVTGLGIDEDGDVDTKLVGWLKKGNSSNFVLSKYLLIGLAAICFGLLINWFINPGINTFNWFAYSFMLNLFLVFSQFKVIKREYQGLDGISKSIGVYADLLKDIEGEEFQSDILVKAKYQLDKDELSASSTLKELSKILDGFDQLNNVVALFVTNGLYHFHLHTLRRLFEWKHQYGDSIQDWISVIAKFDEYSSIANYAYNHPDFSYPLKNEALEIEAENLGHPLLRSDKRVNNSITFNSFKYIILTGSNMSGKSTFLRALGVNLVLMKIGSPVCAGSMASFPFKILTSMKLVDSIEKEESYFQAEVLRLKKIQTELEKDQACFVLLDEILRGTNSDDKRKGTRLFMERIGNYNAKGVTATHDIDIADLAESKPSIFNAKYFESTVVQDQLHFDYILRDGVCTTPNATKLMQAQGII